MPPTTFVRVLDEDPELRAAVSASARARARTAAVAPLLTLQRGPWGPPAEPSHARRDLGLLVLEGLLSRDFRVAGRTFTELRGPDDLLRPWDDVGEVSSVRGEI